MAPPEAGVPIAEEAKKVLFRRMIDQGRDAVVSMKIMAFWMWLETHDGFQDIIAKLSSGDDGFLNLVISEAAAALASLQDHTSLNSTQNLAQSVVSLAVLLADKQKALSSVVDIYKRVCCVLFEDILKERRIEKGLGNAATVDFCKLPSDDVSSSEQNKAPDGAGGRSSSLFDSNLNPSAREWNPSVDRAPEEDRCLFLTFSNGSPLDEDQIVKFFTREYGDCVENIYVHRPNPQKVQLPDQHTSVHLPDQPRLPADQHTVPLPDQQGAHGLDQLHPLFGKVVFKSSSMPAVILKGGQEIKFLVDGKPLRCKKFVPRRLRLS